MTTDTLLPKKFDKLLIANRGEIALRIIRACHELGVGTVAVYSDADRNAPHVRYADEAYYIGPPPARESYLVIGKLIDVARRSGAQAVHPGYGFLAERAEFAQACLDAGLVFVGPSSYAIQVMGDKQMARQTVKAAGVPIVPGTEPGLNDDELIAAADQVGYPLLVKAAAGGGGKGMRPVYQPAELPNALAAARREAQAAFGDGTVYLEKMISEGRHIEIQVMADMHGNTIHLGERECSLQRRHQKLIEEAPSFAVDEELRQRMGAVAVAAAQSVNYANAGTIEFLMDREKNFYFLEMNTRVQVEHPVTELVTGVDIVQEQLRVARGRKLRYTQEDIKLRGWAIECRINAEDPYNNYLPSTGTITTIRLPAGPGVRVDSGVYPGYQVTPYYDPMISKLICYGESRGEAVLRMRRALEEYRIMGVKTNIPFHQHMMDSHRFLSGQFDTKFVEERFSMSDREAAEHLEAAILATLVAHRQSQQASQIISPGERDTTNWKWISRWERLHK
ncbi:MAG: acetyl-CoA carboxylase biotin carboxylase subunit [Chloroflexi bacterium]|nr:acetyl-CoA carboxylase biotin carboxylase subunit [Chloroflexota bacterium]MCI0575242.1 acetyl-CoA carboxylase biotin carboxylase subunit [Chloroflexota bacterium]MCI0648837.1 acetyl-CoA carboxylase biotin carboxylase subunit [Chloroflexota bacterium]MCI0726592.1 acetyl-CoA carboxylase biotin carboxylase subunit [Chloroflexota bacterium]